MDESVRRTDGGDSAFTIYTSEKKGTPKFIFDVADIVRVNNVNRIEMGRYVARRKYGRVVFVFEWTW